jgi:hypothetical protein
MSMEPFREMNPMERSLIRKLLAAGFPGRDELSKQIDSSKVRTIDEGGSLEFSVVSTVNADDVKYRVPAEGEYEDSDGIIVHVLLHVVGSKVQELEFFREDNSPVQTWPDASLVRVFAPE